MELRWTDWHKLCHILWSNCERLTFPTTARNMHRSKTECPCVVFYGFKHITSSSHLVISISWPCAEAIFSRDSGSRLAWGLGQSVSSNINVKMPSRNKEYRNRWSTMTMPKKKPNMCIACKTANLWYETTLLWMMPQGGYLCCGVLGYARALNYDPRSGMLRYVIPSSIVAQVCYHLP